MTDVIVIGAGPVGLACGIEVRRAGLSCRIIEKGALVNSLTGYPANMEFFSTPDLLAIGGHPFATQRYKPLREEGIDYYRGVAQAESLDIRLYERVTGLEGESGTFEVVTDRSRHIARHVIVATGFFDIPNPLDVPGEDLAKVSHYFREPYAYTGQRVAVIGAKNSAAKAALQCFRHGADVTLVVRGEKLTDSIKYWLLPDLENRIAEGAIKAFFGTTVLGIHADRLELQTPEGLVSLPNDWVLAMTGYRPDYAFLSALDLPIADDVHLTPIYDEKTFESGRPGVYLAGTVCGGLRTSRWFIENGRFHARVIARHLAPRSG